MERLVPLLGKTLVIVAHPDDETVGCGALLQRVREPLVLFATDGAPRDRFFWEKYGSREAYARTRYEEARQAMAHLGVERFEFLSPADHPNKRFADQDLFLNIPQALEAISEIVTHTRPEALLTLAYEGGHPDHDTCAFLAWWIGREHVLPVWEMPLYHRSPGGVMVRQEFIVPEGDEVLFDTTMEEVGRQRLAFEAYESQADTLSLFNPAIERFRPQTNYNFTRPPHPGVLNYEAWQWPVSGAQVVQSFGCCINCHLHPFEVHHPGSGIRGLA